MLEAILFHKINKKLWNKYDVADACVMVSRRHNKNLQKRMVSQHCFNEWMIDFSKIDELKNSF